MAEYPRMYEDLPSPRAALEHLRRNREGVLLADGLAERIRFVIDGATGHIVFPTHPSCIAASEVVLFVPEEDPHNEPELQLLLATTELDPLCDEPCDRWKAYHGEPLFTHWASGDIESARFRGEVIDEGPLCCRNPLMPVEPRLCKTLNGDRQRLAQICKNRAGVSPREPVAVGVDAAGFDVRARFGVVRVPFDRECASCDDAAAMIESLVSGQRV
jgi:hypothetical protein